MMSSAGCSDISAQVPNARVVSERSAVSGAAPYNIGSVASVICSNGYTLQVGQCSIIRYSRFEFTFMSSCSISIRQQFIIQYGQFDFQLNIS